MSLTTDKMKERIIKLEEKQAQLEARKKQIQARYNTQRRKEETKRLIEKGKAIEKLQGEEAKNISPEDTLEWIESNFSSKNKRVNNRVD